MHKKTNLFWRSPSDSSFVVDPAEQEAVNRILTQYLPDKQVQPSPSAQTTA
jgi:hypothetical protein